MYVGCGARSLRVSRGTQATLIPTKLAREQQHGWTMAAAAGLLRIVDGVRHHGVHHRVGLTVGDVGEEQHGGASGHVCQTVPTPQRTHSSLNIFYRDGGQEPSASLMLGDVRGEGGLGHVQHAQHREKGGDDSTRHDAAPLAARDSYLPPPLFLSRSLSAPSEPLAEERDNDKRSVDTLLVAEEAAQKLILSTAADHLLGGDGQLGHSGQHLGAVLAPANSAHQVVYCPEAAEAAVAAAAAAAAAAVAAAGGGSMYIPGEAGERDIEVVVESGEDLGKEEMLLEHAALQEQEQAKDKEQEQQLPGQGQPLNACQGDGIEWPTSNAKDGRSLLLLE